MKVAVKEVKVGKANVVRVNAEMELGMAKPADREVAIELRPAVNVDLAETVLDVVKAASVVDVVPAAISRERMQRRFADLHRQEPPRQKASGASSGFLDQTTSHNHAAFELASPMGLLQSFKTVISRKATLSLSARTSPARTGMQVHNVLRALAAHREALAADRAVAPAAVAVEAAAPGASERRTA